MGLAIIALGLFLLLIGELALDLFVPRLSFVVVSAGLLYLFGGRKILKTWLPCRETLGNRLQASDNGLEAAVQDLSGRLTRLEGMVVEMISQLVQGLTKSPSKQSLGQVRPSPGYTIPYTSMENPLQPRKGWWS